MGAASSRAAHRCSGRRRVHVQSMASPSRVADPGHGCRQPPHYCHVAQVLQVRSMAGRSFEWRCPRRELGVSRSSVRLPLTLISTLSTTGPPAPLLRQLIPQEFGATVNRLPANNDASFAVTNAHASGDPASVGNHRAGCSNNEQHSHHDAVGVPQCVNDAYALHRASDCLHSTR
jgi:hypothetical protein